MSEQQFCLKWNNYSVSVTSVFKDLLENQEMCDVTLSTKEKNIKAHRIVLTACSAFFKNIFQDVKEWQHPVIFLKDTKFEDLRGIIEFIYHGEVSIDQGALPSFLLVAESLKIKGLTEESQRNEATNSSHIRASNANLEDRSSFSSTSNGLEGKGVLRVKPELQLEDMNTTEDGPLVEDEDEEEEEEELMEPELKSSSFESITEEQRNKLDGEELVLKGPTISLDSPLILEPSLDTNLSNPALLGAKKTCPYCFQQLSWHALSRHIRDMHKAKSDLVNCQYCLKTFRNKNSLGCHIWRFHKRGREPKATYGAADQKIREPKTAAFSVGVIGGGIGGVGIVGESAGFSGGGGGEAATFGEAKSSVAPTLS